MNEPRTAPPRFTDSEPGDEIERPFRPSSLVALMLGVLSVVAVFTLQLIFLPILALAVGLYACRPSRYPSIQPVGRSVSLVGIALALFFGSWGAAFSSVRAASLSADASTLAIQWLTLLGDGRREFAYELTMLKDQRQLESMSLADYYSPSDSTAYENYSAFIAREPVRLIMDAGDKPQWVVDSVLHTDRAINTDSVSFRIVDKTGAVPRPLVITMERTLAHDSNRHPDPQAPRQWHVKGFRFEEA